MDTCVSRRQLLRFAAAFAPAARLLAWQDNAKYSADVNVVNVLATVHDKNNVIVKNLIKDDFTLEEDARPQQITYFAQQSDLPLTLGLLVDTSGSLRNQIESERRASYKFFDQVLHEDKDRAFLIHFDREVELLQDLTSSRTELDKALDDLGTNGARPQLNRRSQGQPYPSGGGQGRGQGRGAFGGTTLYDAVLLASDELMAKQKGRKAVVLLSDGVDNGSKVSLPAAIESAQRSDTLVYSIHFAGTNTPARGGFSGPGLGGGGRRRGGIGFPGQGGGYPGGGQAPGGTSSERADGKKVLQRLSSETGGSYYEISTKQPLDKIYAQIQDELRNQYSLGYTSDQTGAGFRRIHLNVRLKNMTVQTREGYYARDATSKL